MVRAVDGKIEIPGSSSAGEIFVFLFLFFYLPHLRKAKNPPHLRKAKKTLRICGRRTLFLPKKLRILCKIYYINNRYDRRFTDHLRPPPFWQTSSNYGLLGMRTRRGKGGPHQVSTRTDALPRRRAFVARALFGLALYTDSGGGGAKVGLLIEKEKEGREGPNRSTAKEQI